MEIIGLLTMSGESYIEFKVVGVSKYLSLSTNRRIRQNFKCNI